MPVTKRSRRATGARKTGSTIGRKAAGRSAARKATKKAAPSRSRARSTKTDALSLLKDDHDRVDKMFKRYEKMKADDERKQALREQILTEVRVHAQVEEEVFYPALRAAFEDEGKDKEMKLLAEADTEHATVKWLMAELDGGSSGDGEKTDACVKVMGEYIKHHVEEEEGPMFRAARKTDLDLAALGAQMVARKRELMGEPPADGPSTTADRRPTTRRAAPPPAY